MITVSLHEVNLPDYSLPYLINGDSSGLSEGDISRIDSYMEYYYHLASIHVGGSVVISVDSEEGVFCGSPVFGLPCNCYEASIAVLKS